jgi:hypothetical protein
VGGKTSTSQQSVSVPPAVLAQYQSVMSQANQVAQTPFQSYGSGTNADGTTQQFVAPTNATQNAGIANTNAQANAAQPGYATAQNTLSGAQAGTTGINNAATGLAAASAGQVNADPITGQQINSYLSPYLSDVLGSTSTLLNQNNQQQQSGQLGTAIQSGAFGSDRTGIAAANLEQQQNLANANIYSGIANTGYNNALGVAQQQQGVNLSAGQANRAALGSAGNELASIGQTAYGEGANTASEQGALASGAQTAGLQGANAQIAAGTVQQQTAQAQDTAEYNQFLQQQSYPFQVTQFLGNLAEGTGALSGSQTTTTQPGGFFSDKRLKHDIKKIGETYDKQSIYSYKMHGDNRTHIGLMAQEVEKKKPQAVGVDGRSGYKIVDYGLATEKAANRGHFYEGGVVPMRRVAKAGGGPSIVDAGDLQAILAAQQAMYAPMAGSAGVYGGSGGSVPRGGSSRVPAPEGAVPHLVTAQGGLKQQPTGVQNLSSAASLYKQGKGIYDDTQKPVRHTTTTTTDGGLAPAAWSAPGQNFDGSAAAMAPDTTEASVSPSDYARGGRAGYDDGGGVDFDDLVGQHGAMYGQGSGSRGGIDIPSGGGGTHTLAVASGSPTPAPSGSSNLNQGLGLAQKGYQAYKHFNTPSTAPDSAPNTGPWSSPGVSGASIDGSTPVDMSGGFDGSAGYGVAAPAAAPAAADAGAAAGADAGAASVAGSAAGAAGAGAADAAIAGGADAAAAAAAEALAADAAVAVIAAKRGGRIGYDAGGMPYSSDDGQLDIPDTSSGAAKLQTAGALVKQPTGLQTLETLGTQQGAQGAISGMFSNEALARGGVAGRRRGYDDGGDVDDTDAGPSTPSDAPAVPDKAPGVKPADLKMDSGPSWWDRNKGKAIPLLEGLAAMGTAPTRHLGVALAAGLGAGAGAYVPTQQGLASTRQTEAETQGINIKNQMAQQNLDLYKQAVAGMNAAPATAAPSAPKAGPTPTSAADIPGYYQGKYRVNPVMTPQEAKNISIAKMVDAQRGTNLSAAAQLTFENRVKQQQFQAQTGAQGDYDKLVNGVVNANQQGDSAYTNLKQINPGLADGVARQAGLDPTNQDSWSAQQKTLADQTAAKIAAQHAAEIHQYTGSEYKGDNAVDTRTNTPAVGPAAAQLTPEQRSNRQIKLAEPVTYGAGLPTPIGAAAGIGQQPPGASGGPPTPTRPSQRQPSVVEPSPAAATPQTQLLSSVDLKAMPKLPTPPPVTDQVSLENAKKINDQNREVQNQALAPLKQQVEAAARNTAIYSQLEKTLANANPREFGPSSASYKALANFKTYLSGIPPDGLVNQAEADKYLAQLGVGGSKQLLGSDQQLRQQEMMLLMAHANPNIDQPLQVIKNLAAFGKAGNTYDLKAGNTGIEAIRNGADPIKVPGVIENQAHRADYINGELTSPQAAKDYLKTHPEAAPHFKQKYGYLP